MTLLGTAGPPAPGRPLPDLKATRGSPTKKLFRSVAEYFEPAAPSWDVSMTVTKPDWRIAVKKGDRLNVSATYDTRRASVVRVDGDHGRLRAEGGAARPTRSARGSTRATLTHRPPPRERQPRRPAAADACATLPACQRRLTDSVFIENFLYRRGRLQPARQARRPPWCGPASRCVHEPRRDHRDLGGPRATRSPRARRPVPRRPASPTRSPTPRSVRLRRARLRPPGVHPGSAHHVDTPRPQGRDVHLLLPHPPVHARGVPRGRQVALSAAIRRRAPGRRRPPACRPPSRSR